MNGTIQDITSRRSTRAFTEKQVAGNELSLVLGAGIAAPSSMNRQPWHFTVIQDRAVLDWMVETNKKIVLSSPELMKSNGWINAPGYDNFYRAPTVIVISGRKDNPWHVCDCALAMENMALAAESISLGTCIVASTRFLFMGEKAKEHAHKLGIPQGYVPLYALALGYPAAEASQRTPRNKECVNYIR